MSDSSYRYWLAGYDAPINNQALGFRDGHGWGWRQDDDQISNIYATWDNWNRHGVDISCNELERPPLWSTTEPAIHSATTPSGTHSSEARLVFRIVIPVEVIAASVIWAITGYITGRYIHKRNALRMQKTMATAGKA